jgi:hypothetical protein
MGDEDEQRRHRECRRRAHPEVADAEDQAGHTAQTQQAGQRWADDARGDDRADHGTTTPGSDQQPGRRVTPAEAVRYEDGEDADESGPDGEGRLR